MTSSYVKPPSGASPGNANLTYHDEVDDILGQWLRERPDLDPSPMGVFGRISRVYTLAKARQAATLNAFGLNLAAFDVLANLRRSGPPFRKSPSDLANSSMLTSGGVTFRLDKLEAQGLIRRVPSKEDRRAVYAELTDRGLEIINDVIGSHLATEAAMLGELSAEERTQLVGLLRSLEHSVMGVRSDGNGETEGDAEQV